MKTIITVLLILFCFSASVQSDTTLTFRDSTKNYTFTNVYRVINDITLQKNKQDLFRAASDTTVVPWRLTIHVYYYASKADYEARKPELNERRYSYDFGTAYPTSTLLFNRIKLLLQ